MLVLLYKGVELNAGGDTCLVCLSPCGWGDWPFLDQLIEGGCFGSINLTWEGNWFGHLGEMGVLCDHLLSGICSVYLCPLCVKLVWTTC